MVSMPKVVLEILHCFLMVRRIIWYSVPRAGWLIIMPNFDAFSVAAWMHGSRCSFSVHAILTLFTCPLKCFLCNLHTDPFTACKGLSHWKKKKDFLDTLFHFQPCLLPATVSMHSLMK